MKFLNNLELIFKDVLEEVKNKGYCFRNISCSDLCLLLEQEACSLNLEHADHVNYPINKNKQTSVFQSHERAYRLLGLDARDVKLTSELCFEFSELAKGFKSDYPELDGWLLNEIGYQKYRDERDYISPHRDRASDKIFSVTITLVGSAYIRIHECLVDPPDYSQLKQVDEWLAIPGTIMFLRAPGFGCGTQVIHEVMPPLNGHRIILNLRMRDSVLKAPKEYAIFTKQL